MQLTSKRIAIRYQSFALKRRASGSNQKNSIGREKPDVSMENDIVVVALLTSGEKILTCTRCYITMQLQVKITMGGMETNIALFLWVLLHLNILIIICGNRIKNGRCE